MISKFFRIKHLATLFAVVGALTSCVSDEEQLVPGGGTAENRQMVFRINVPAGTSHHTRAIAEGGAADNAVGDLLFLMFGSNDKLLADDNGYRIVTTDKIKDTSDENAYTVKVEIPQGAVKALVVANWEALALEGDATPAENLIASLAGKTFSEVVADKSQFNYDAFPGDVDFTDDHAYHLMGSRPFDLSTATTAAIPLTRSLAKINITVSNNLTVVGNDDQGGQLTALDGFKLKKIRLVNVNRQAQVFPPVSTTAGTMNDDTTDAFASGTLYDYIEYAAGNSTSFVDKIFLPETAIAAAIKEADEIPDLPGLPIGQGGAVWRDPLARWKAAPALLIQATLKQNGTSVDRWFRVNLRMADTADGNRLKHVDLLRNHKYTVDITGIGGMGYPTPDEAYNALPSDLIITIVAVSDDELNDIVYNGQYYLATNGPAFEYIALPNNGGVLKIYTDHPGGWKIERIEGNDDGWLTSVDIVAGKEGAAKTKAELAFSITGTNHVSNQVVDAPRTAVVTISAGAISRQIEITQKSTNGVRNAGTAPGVIGYLFHPGYPDHYTLTMDKDDNDDANGIVYVAYFKYNSLVALSSQNTSAFTPNDVVAWPTPDWAADRTAMEAKFSGAADATAAYALITASSTISSTPNPANAQGDACAYYFGSEWRMPTRAESEAFTGGASGSISAGTFAYTPASGYQPGLGLFIAGPLDPSGNPYSLPITGNRVTDGKMTLQGDYGYYWTSSSRYFLMFQRNNSFSYSQVSTGTLQSIAKPIRCHRVQ